MHPGMRPAFLSHLQPYPLPYHDHNVNVQHLHDQLLQGMMQFGPFDPLYQQQHFPVQEEPPHPLICMTSDVKPRLRWTPELHGRFVDAVDHLGGPFKATPKAIMNVMKMRGLTLYQLKSHLQKFRLGKCEGKTWKPPKDGIRKRANSATTPPVGLGSSSVPSNINDSFQPLQVPQHSSVDSFDSYMASLGYLPTLCSDGFAELGKGGGEGLRDSGEGLRDSDEDPALAYLNLDAGEMSTHRNGVAGDDSGWFAGEFSLKG
ncbi:uncharacterized protein LOC131323464 [Rhododendron vialii]|uniref:uncharacterized protein LOC131323464 n=1 Tax=Rhododendron vialii TaxID=182163 RepID=UPI00265E8269|nr:uncharacterized protein LOC131323464 [Rhododendron vialii]